MVLAWGLVDHDHDLHTINLEIVGLSLRTIFLTKTNFIKIDVKINVSSSLCNYALSWNMSIIGITMIGHVTHIHVTVQWYMPVKF